MNQIGIEMREVDALEKVLGQVKYGADLSINDPLHLKVVRSTRPHAKIIKIETKEANKVEGLEIVFTANDIPGRNLLGTITKDQPVLAGDRVRYIGDPVALVVANTMEAAEEAANKVIILYEDLPSVNDPEEALKPQAALIHPNRNLLIEFNVLKGDVQAGFKAAEVIIEEDYETTWVDHASLEPDAGISYLDEEGRVTVVCPSKLKPAAAIQSV